MHLSPSEKLNSLLKSNRLLLHSLLYDVKQDLTRLFVNLNIFMHFFQKTNIFPNCFLSSITFYQFVLTLSEGIITNRILYYNNK